ncbi:PepSY domain-containing protein [Massilia genomosp. 1]|uniref:PepSY domain-containing protein n=1 Tax=Massilia genomosp. 1 TaxID=2609280 RepID=A0ABX0MMW8_9BURK|nr:PepSY domain-containing protein [Massilia genomosp. 1]NHZ64103.1 hypothetical protein [Massilia genomosp. 1]
MKSSTLKTYIAVHTWVGLVAGFALFIAFYAGAITVFTKRTAHADQFRRRGAQGGQRRRGARDDAAAI